jgi:hypothetical protein
MAAWDERSKMSIEIQRRLCIEKKLQDEIRRGNGDSSYAKSLESKCKASSHSLHEQFNWVQHNK